MNIKRIFLIVLDSFGIGSMPDAFIYGDDGANTIRSVSSEKDFQVINMKKLGLFNIDGVNIGDKCENPIGAYARLSELSKGKDTTTGHWEIAGIISKKPFPTYPDGFGDDIINEFCQKTGCGVLCNKPYSGTDVIKDYGQEHLDTGKLIVYTSADSVFQIAAHEDIVPVEKLYEYCKITREILQGENAVGRVIARPFAGVAPDFYRTSGRHDFSLEPPCETVLDQIKNWGMEVISVGKINDIFSGKGITKSYPTSSNDEGIERLVEIMDNSFNGLCFVNLVDFDMIYGHRNDSKGYAKAITDFDEKLSHIIGKLTDEDVLMITADHGCDPKFKGTDHTREYVPLMIYGDKIKPVNLGSLNGFDTVGMTICEMLGIKDNCQKSVYDKIIKQ